MGPYVRDYPCGPVRVAGLWVHRLHVVCVHSCRSWAISAVKTGIKFTVLTAGPSALAGFLAR